MIKKFLCITMFIVIILFSSCSRPSGEISDPSCPYPSGDISGPSISSAPPESQNDDTEYFERYYDRLQTHKPTNAEAQSITKGMTYKEVVDRLGKPHKSASGTRNYFFYWYTQEGGRISALFERLVFIDDEEAIRIHDMEDLLKYGVANWVRFYEQASDTVAFAESPSEPSETTVPPEPEPIPEPITTPVDEW